jgi:hypothetical protein
MNNEYTVIEHNSQTNEIVERQMTQKEISDLENRRAQETQALQDIQAKEAAKASALAKLAALGLTEDEVNGLIS